MLLISLLGEQAIVDDAAGQVRTRSSRAVALVGYLVVHAGVPQPRARLAAQLWPDSSDGQALTNLRRELHHLRQALGTEQALEVDPTTLCWRDTATCRVDLRIFQRRVELARAPGSSDAEVIEHGLAALAAYRGDLLPGVYDEWVADARETVLRDCVRLCDDVVEAAGRAHVPATAVEVARRRILLAPLEETGYRSLMERQAELGDRAGAISTYHHCASVLERELGVEPDPATSRTLERLIGRGPPAGSGGRRAGTPARSGPVGTGLVAREVELSRLAALWRVTKTGRAAVVVVHGGPGVGKTRLVGELAELARRDSAVVATAQCFESSGRLSLGPVAEWLREPAFRAAGTKLAPVWRNEVHRLVPPDPTDPGTQVRDTVDMWQRNRFFEGLAHGLAAVHRPTFLILDDVQWCDEDTLSFLTFLVRQAAESPLLLALTQRPEHGRDARTVLRWMSRLRADDRLHRVDLSPLDLRETTELAESLTGRAPDDAEAALLYAATDGFPLYVVEAARSATPSTGLSDVLRQRLEQASPEAQELAGLAAAVGRDFSLALLTEASDLDADAVALAVDELWRHRIVRELKGGYDFSHDLLRETAYQQVSPPRRWLLHRRLAQALELTSSGHLDEVSAQLAEQYWKAGNRERALTHYRRATKVAAGLFAHAESIRLARMTLELVRGLPEGRDRDAQELACLEALAPVLNASRGYSSPELQETFERATLLARRLGREDSWITGTVGLWASRFVQGRNQQAHEIAEQLLVRVQPGDHRFGQSRLSLAGSELSLGMPAAALDHFDAACAVMGEESLTFGTRAWVHTQAWSAHAAWTLSDDEGARRRADEAVARARDSDHPYSLTVALAYSAVTHQLLGDRDRLTATVTELAGLCERLGFAYYSQWAVVLDGWLQGGAEGAHRVRQGIDALREEGAYARMPYWLSLLADVHEDVERKAATLDAALVAAAARDDRWWMPELMRLRAALDDPASAQGRLSRAARMAAEQGSLALLARCEADLAALTSVPQRG